VQELQKLSAAQPVTEIQLNELVTSMMLPPVSASGELLPADSLKEKNATEEKDVAQRKEKELALINPASCPAKV
jgi:hypothetical protein